MRVIGFDHLVLNVGDAERSIDFYVGRLGLEPVRVEEWRCGEVPFPSLRVTPTTLIDLVENPNAFPGRNVDHICLVVERTDFDEVAASGEFTVLSGPGPRFGAQGMGYSLYVRDPDGNAVELRWYGRPDGHPK